MADIEAWKEHFINMAEGKISPDNNGIWVVRIKKKNEGNDANSQPLTLVTPTQQAVEIAKNDVKNSIRGVKRRRKGMMFE